MSGAPANGRHWAPVVEGGETQSPPPERVRTPIFPVRALRVLIRPVSIKAKLSRILLVSLVLVLVALGFMVNSRLTAYREAANTSRVVTVSLSVQELVHALQKERGLTNGLLGGGQYYRASVTAQRIQTDSALTDLRTQLRDPAYPATVTGQVRSALGKLDQLATIRNQVDSGQAQATTVFSFYTDATRGLNGLELGLDRAQDPDLRRGLQALYALSDLKDYTDWERGLLNGVFSAGAFLPGQYQQFAEIRAHRQVALDQYEHFATPAQRQAVESVLSLPIATRSANFEAIAVASVNGPLTEHVDAQNHWWNQMTLVINDLRTVQRQVGADITGRAGQLQSGALRELVVFLLIALLAIAAEIALVISASRSIIDPLGSLASGADDVAMHRLPDAVAVLENATGEEVQRPEPIPLTVPRHAGTEIHRLASALGRLQATALRLAGEQAVIRRNTTVSLANLGRRNQNLVRRQLALISDFEREELDPKMLANMFELDHLATRMRRNAESLLVLVGETGPRMWAKPLPIVDVIRASLSEVEDYRRVALKRIDEVYISGSAVSEVAHMLAELLENGLSFSPPDVEVEIHGRKVGNRYTIAVVDHGSGMQPDALVKANARLHDEENYLVAPTRFLGHYVVGRLARRLGVEVNLAPAPITGITARLVLPPDLLADPSAQPREAPSLTAPSSAAPSSAAPSSAAQSSAEASVGSSSAGAVAEALPRRNGRTVLRPLGRQSLAGGPPEPRASEPPARPAGVPSPLTPLRASQQPPMPQQPMPRRPGQPMPRQPVSSPLASIQAQPHESAQPATSQPAAAQPATSQPAADQPGTDQPGPDQPGTDHPGTDHPGASRPVSDRPVSDRPVSDRPVSDQPVSHQPGTDQPGASAEVNAGGSMATLAATTQRVRVDVRGERERTRNGLVKRQARANRARPALSTRPPTVVPRQFAEPTPRERTPSDVGAMLSSYRAGHQRGERGEPRASAPHQPTRPQPTSEPSASGVSTPGRPDAGAPSAGEPSVNQYQRTEPEYPASQEGSS